MTDHSFSNVLNRRQLLRRLAGGTGMLGLAGLLQRSNALPPSPGNPGKIEYPNYQPRAKRVIFLFLNGGPAQLDMFDPKPALAERGEQPRAFAKHGESGLELSELLPNLARCADDLCVIRSMHTETANHDPAVIQMHLGSNQFKRPSLGAWGLYGLGVENESMPGYVVMRPGSGMRVGARLWSSGFLPSQFQGTEIVTKSMELTQLLQHIRGSSFSLAEQRQQLDALKALNKAHMAETAGDAEMEAEIRAMETAYRMQIEATDAFDISTESESMRERYGNGTFAKSCLLARRLAERGVRFTTIYYSGGSQGSWDTHQRHNDQMKTLCANTDRAVGALIEDLKVRGLLEDTLVMMGGEFGRTSQGKGESTGHQNQGFSMMLAGGGVRGGIAHGATEELGAGIAENPVGIPDLHATILHLMGIDHRQLTYHQAGRHFRLNEDYGEIVTEIVA